MEMPDEKENVRDDWAINPIQDQSSAVNQLQHLSKK